MEMMEAKIVVFFMTRWRIHFEADEIYKVCSEIGRPSQREVDRHEHVLLAKKIGVLKKALNLVEYLLQENNSDCNVITELGFPCTMRNTPFNGNNPVQVQLC
ncbi:hypothetical protein C5167_025141 [Papaver somniferum]|uniref:Uncharacterized protein n=1 Tax=Papaver somniferum TaxID=3469 RepID=A0A4Y7JTK0_PAPSO|nr:hypothetical protein C5167_025141 [Papaver somniferum]